MSNNKKNKNIGIYLLLYSVVCTIVKFTIRTISPIYAVILISIPLLIVSIAYAKTKWRGTERIMNLLFISLLDIASILLCMNIIVDELFPSYLKEHEKFFNGSFIAFVCLFSASAIFSILAKFIYKSR